MTCLSKYPRIEDIFRKYEISKTTRWVMGYKREMVTGTSPTVKTIMNAYADQKPNGIYDWLNSYLVDLAIFEGKTATAVAYQINSISHSIVEQYHYLKLTELMLFFSMFKAGELISKDGDDMTKMYGAFSGKTIMSALRIFVLKHRNNIIYEEEQKKLPTFDVDYTKFLINVKKEEESKPKPKLRPKFSQSLIDEHNRQFLASLNNEQ